MHKAEPGISVNSDATLRARRHVSFDHEFNAVNVRLFVIKRRTMLLQRLIGLARCKSIEKYTNCRETRGENGSARRNALPLLPITFKLEYNSNTKKMKNGKSRGDYATRYVQRRKKYLQSEKFAGKFLRANN